MARWAASLSILATVATLAACRTPLPSPGPRVGAARGRALTPPELFPDDLDFVVRIDAARIRQNPMLAGVVRDLAKTSNSEMLASVKTSLSDADAVWIGTRWMSDGFHGDGVLAIEGAMAKDARAADLPRDLQVHQRPAGSRGEAALEIVVRDRGVVLATAAEADAVLRVIHAGPDETRLDPPARGLISFAGRAGANAPFDVVRASETLQGMTEGLVGYAGTIDEGESIEVEAVLSYASGNDAAKAAARAKEVVARLGNAGGAVGTMGNSVKLTEIGSSLRVRASVPFAWLATLH